MKSRHAACVAVAAIFFACGVARAADGAIPWSTMPETNPLDFGTLHLSPLEGWRPADSNNWWISVTTTYFNVWSATWHIRTIHGELHREHQPLGSDELRLLEERGPTDHIYQLDLEGYRFDIAAVRRFGWGTVLLRVPAIDIGQPRWDALGEAAHQFLGAERVRSIFPRGRTVLYMRTPQHRVELRDEIEGFRLGNPSVSVSWPLPFRSSFDQRVVVAAQIPMARGRANTLAASGGWDVGVRWFAQRRWRESDVLLGAGYTFVDQRATFFGFERANPWHAVGQVNRPVGSRLALAVGARLDSSIVANEFEGEAGRPDLNLNVGVVALISRNSLLSFSLGENVPRVGLGADWSFHLQFTTAIRSNRGEGGR